MDNQAFERLTWVYSRHIRIDRVCSLPLACCRCNGRVPCSPSWWRSCWGSRRPPTMPPQSTGGWVWGGLRFVVSSRSDWILKVATFWVATFLWCQVYDVVSCCTEMTQQKYFDQASQDDLLLPFLQFCCHQFDMSMYMYCERWLTLTVEKHDVHRANIM